MPKSLRLLRRPPVAPAREQAVKPRTGAATSIPGLLGIFHDVRVFPVEALQSEAVWNCAINYPQSPFMRAFQHATAEPICRRACSRTGMGRPYARDPSAEGGA